MIRWGRSKALVIGLAALLAAGCGKDDAPAANPAPGQPAGAGAGSSSPPPGSKWSAEEYSRTANACADGGARHHSQHPREKWLNYCFCVYTVVAAQMTLADFQRRYNEVYAQLVQNKTDENCLRSAGIIQ